MANRCLCSSYSKLMPVEAHLSRKLIPLFILLLFAILSGCSGAPSVLAPASPGAGKVAELFWIVFGIAVVIFVGVEAALIFAVLRFRERPDRPEPDQNSGNLRLEIAWTAAPAIILLGIFVAMISTMNAVAQPQPDALRVKVVGYQWWWEIQYPDLGITTATDLHVPVGQPVRVELVAGDVIHSFWAPELFGKTDVIPGRSNWTQFTASLPGNFRGACAEFCGVQHANMGFVIMAEPREEFDRWVLQMRAPAVAAAGQAARGEQALLSGGCVSCHTIDGTRAQGKIGPNLTHFASRQSIAGLTRQNNPEALASWLKNPQAVKPGSRMPDLGLSQETIQDLVAYLESLK